MWCTQLSRVACAPLVTLSLPILLWPHTRPVALGTNFFTQSGLCDSKLVTLCYQYMIGVVEDE